MRCPECTAPYSDVLETRKHKGGLKRRRICGNGHKFTTLEQPYGLTTAQLAEVPDEARAAYRAVVLGGLTAAEYARKTDRHRSTVGRWVTQVKKLHEKKLARDAS